MIPRKHFKEIYELKRSYFYHLCHFNEYMLEHLEEYFLTRSIYTINPSVRTTNIRGFFKGLTDEMTFRYEDILYHDLL